MTIYHVELLEGDPITIDAQAVRVIDGALSFFAAAPPEPLQPVAIHAHGTWRRCHAESPAPAPTASARLWTTSPA